jgi:hypothetical protein
MNGSCNHTREKLNPPTLEWKLMQKRVQNSICARNTSTRIPTSVSCRISYSTMSSNLPLAIACGVLVIASTSLVLYNVLSPGSRNESQHTSGTNASQRVEREDADRQPPANLEPPGQGLGLPPPPPPPYVPPAPAPPVYIIAPQMPMPMYNPPPLVEARPPFNPGPPPIRPGNQVSTVRPAFERLNDLQLLIRQRQPMYSEEWEEFHSTEPIADNVAFLIFSRTQRAPYVPRTLSLLEIRSEALKRVLRGCDSLKSLDALFDPISRVPSDLFQTNIRFMVTHYSIT